MNINACVWGVLFPMRLIGGPLFTGCAAYLPRCCERWQCMCLRPTYREAVAGRFLVNISQLPILWHCCVGLQGCVHVVAVQQRAQGRWNVAVGSAGGHAASSNPPVRGQVLLLASSVHATPRDVNWVCGCCPRAVTC